MEKVIVDKRIFDNYSNLTIGMVIIKEIDNTRALDLADDFATMEAYLKQKFKEVNLASYPVIKDWRDIYKSFGEKKFRASIEALIRRTINDKGLPRINSLVDLYNLVSLKYEMPVGGENIDAMDSDLELTYATGQEIFIPFETAKQENPNVGEIIYKFGNNVICRCFNYRDSELTKLTSETKNAIFFMERLDSNTESLEDAINELAEVIIEHLGGQVIKKAVFDKNNCVVTL